MISVLLVFVVVFGLLAQINLGFIPKPTGHRLLSQISAEIKYDAQGYVIKDKSWFNGLSADPGAR